MSVLNAWEIPGIIGAMVAEIIPCCQGIVDERIPTVPAAGTKPIQNVVCKELLDL